MMRKLLTSVLMVLLLGLIYIAASLGIADVFINLAHYDMQQWKKEKKIEDWNKTHSLLKKALFLTPNNPTYLDYMARAYYLLARLGKIDKAEKEQNLEKALEIFKQSVKIRPTWAYTWANIALIKFLLQQYDELFLTAIEKANIFGPGEPFAQRIIIIVGLGAWYHIPASKQQRTRSIILATIEHGLSIQAKRIIPIIKNHPRKNIVCFLRGHKPALENFCKE